MSIPALDGLIIGVFAWYEHGLAFTDGEYADLHAQLYGKSSESPAEYYDGMYDYGGNTYNARVRKDGYVLAWLASGITIINDFNLSPPPLSQRAIQSIMSAAGVTGFNFNKCYYYSFDYPLAERVRWFGSDCVSGASCSRTFYFTVPPDLTVHSEGARYYVFGNSQEAIHEPMGCLFKINDITIASCAGKGGVCMREDIIEDISSYTKPKGEENTVVANGWGYYGGQSKTTFCYLVSD